MNTQIRKMKLERTASPTPQAVLCHGYEIRMFPWKEVLALRELVAAVPPSAAEDEDYPSTDRGPWRVVGSNYGLLLLRAEMPRLFFTAAEWEELGGLLYVTSPLLSVTQVATFTGRRRQVITPAILCGDLFAFLKPGLQRRRWTIPEQAAREWAGLD